MPQYTIHLKYGEGAYFSFLDPFEYQGWDEERGPDEQVTWMYTEGNYGCDCNLSQFIKSFCDDDFQVMKCGDTIKLTGIYEGDRRVWGAETKHWTFDEWLLKSFGHTNQLFKDTGRAEMSFKEFESSIYGSTFAYRMYLELYYYEDFSAFAQAWNEFADTVQARAPLYRLMAGVI